MGIGEAIVRRFHSENWRVAIIDRDANAARTLAQALNSPTVSAHGADVTSMPEMERAIAEVRQSHPDIPIQAVANSAGCFDVRTKLFETTTEDFRKLLDVNVLGAFHFLRAAEPYFGQNASIVHIGSINGTLSGSGLAAYKTSKSALHMMTRCIARELANDPRRIRANVVAPGWVDTPGERRVMAAEGRANVFDDPQSAKFIPLKRRAEASEVANTVYFLSSEQGSGITGQIVHVDGGMTA